MSDRYFDMFPNIFYNNLQCKDITRRVVVNPMLRNNPNVFYPLGEIHPGESWPIRLSRNLMEQYAGSGTGTTGPENKLRFKANGGTVKVLVEVFEK